MKILLAAVTLLLPVAVSAAPIVPIVGSAGAQWHSMGPAVANEPEEHAPNLGRSDAYWAGYSYDRKNGSAGSTACSAGALIMGYQCSWALYTDNGLKQPVGESVPGQEVFYWGHPPSATDPNHNADMSFYFSGPLDLDLRVLSEITAWKVGVEIGWYDVADPTNRTILLGGPGGIPTVNGQYDLGGTSTLNLTGNFGLYYTNHDRGVTFFTQSELNHFFGVGATTGYLSGFGFGLDKLDDEFELNGFDPRLYQQWALFGQGDRFWLGLEDIFGPTTPCTPSNPELGVPCSDYDYNDFIIGGAVKNSVPEPTTLTMLAIGLFGAALALKRRNREE